MAQALEAFLNGARMARELAAAEENPVVRARHIERANWYEEHASWMRAPEDQHEMREAAE